MMTQQFWIQLCRRSFQSTKFVLESEWLLFNGKWANFLLYHDEDKLLFNKMMIIFTLY